MIDEILKLNDKVGTLTDEEKQSMQEITEFLKNKINNRKVKSNKKKR